jgi:fumarate reductase subunit D
MRASTLAIRAAVVFALCGLALGIGMGISNNHSLAPAHAHINLVGWVSLFLFSMFYKTHPALDTSRVARAQVGVWAFGGAVMTTGVTLIYAVGPQYEPIAAVGSLIVFAGLLMFAYVVFRPEPVASAPMSGVAAAE